MKGQDGLHQVYNVSNQNQLPNWSCTINRIQCIKIKIDFLVMFSTEVHLHDIRNLNTPTHKHITFYFLPYFKKLKRSSYIFFQFSHRYNCGNFMAGRFCDLISRLSRAWMSGNKWKCVWWLRKVCLQLTFFASHSSVIITSTPSLK